MLMILGVSIKMTEKERDAVVPLIMKGFRVRLSTVTYLLFRAFMYRILYDGKYCRTALPKLEHLLLVDTLSLIRGVRWEVLLLVYVK